MQTLKHWGVTFEHYDLPQMIRQGDSRDGADVGRLVQGSGRQCFQLVTPPMTAVKDTVATSAPATS